MASDQEQSSRRAVRPSGIALRRRRKLPSVRLGGKRPGRAVALARTLVRLTWLRLRYFRVMRKLREYYRNLLKDLSAVEAFQKRVLMEASFFAVPVGAYP